MERIVENNYFEPQKDKVVSIKEWVITMLIMCIPIVNLVMTFVWAFGSGTKTSKANYFKATLIMLIIGIFIAILLYAILGSIAMNEIYNGTYDAI